jgi:hypothetical protein
MVNRVEARHKITEDACRTMDVNGQWVSYNHRITRGTLGRNIITCSLLPIHIYQGFSSEVSSIAQS